MTYLPERTRILVYERAQGRCEYCLLHDDDTGGTHEVDHIYAEKHGGTDDPINLGFSCAHCNRHKGSDIASLDPETGERVFLFHPRVDSWTDHFQLEGGVIIGRTPQGRATTRLLDMNNPRRVAQRVQLIALQRYP